jgi:hypothetical protein
MEHATRDGHGQARGSAAVVGLGESKNTDGETVLYRQACLSPYYPDIPCRSHFRQWRFWLHKYLQGDEDWALALYGVLLRGFFLFSLLQRVWAKLYDTMIPGMSMNARLIV